MNTSQVRQRTALAAACWLQWGTHLHRVGLHPELPAAPDFSVLSHLSAEAEGCRFVWVYNKTPRNCRQSLYFRALLPMATSLGSGGLLGMASEEQ